MGSGKKWLEYGNAACIVAVAAYTVVLWFYKRALLAAPDVSVTNYISRAFSIVSKPHYVTFFFLGIACIAALAVLCFAQVRSLSRSDSIMGVPAPFLLINVLLGIGLLCVFWDPIFTSAIVVTVGGGGAIYTMSS